MDQELEPTMRNNCELLWKFLTPEIMSGVKASVWDKTHLEEKLMFLETGFDSNTILKVQGGSGAFYTHSFMLAEAAPGLYALLEQISPVEIPGMTIEAVVEIPNMTIEAVALFVVLLYISLTKVIDPIAELDFAIDQHFPAIHHACLKYHVSENLKPVMDAAWHRNVAPTAVRQIVKYGYLVKRVPMPKPNYKCIDIHCHSCSSCLRAGALARVDVKPLASVTSTVREYLNTFMTL